MRERERVGDGESVCVRERGSVCYVKERECSYVRVCVCVIER